MFREIKQYDSPNITKNADVAAVFGRHRSVSGITIHHWGDPNSGATFGGVIDWLCNPASGVSAHCVVTAGEVAYLVNAEDAAWHAGSPEGNAGTVGFELNPRASAADYDTAAQLVAAYREVYGDIMLYTHNYWTNTQCPGRWDVFKLDRLAYKWQKEMYGTVY